MVIRYLSKYENYRFSHIGIRYGKLPGSPVRFSLGTRLSPFASDLGYLNRPAHG